MFLVLPILLVILFLGSVEPNLISWIGFVLKLLAVLVVMIVIKTTHARLKLAQALRLFWGPLAIAGALSVVLALLGW
jgi:NADH:ubiquinone oxidoreductase subunit H